MPFYVRSWFKMRAIFAKIYLSTEKCLSLDAHQVRHHFNLSSHSTHNKATVKTAVKTLSKVLIFNSGPSILLESKDAPYSTNFFIFSNGNVSSFTKLLCSIRTDNPFICSDDVLTLESLALSSYAVEI